MPLTVIHYIPWARSCATRQRAFDCRGGRPWGPPSRTSSLLTDGILEAPRSWSLELVLKVSSSAVNGESVQISTRHECVWVWLSAQVAFYSSQCNSPVTSFLHHGSLQYVTWYSIMSHQIAPYHFALEWWRHVMPSNATTGHDGRCSQGSQIKMSATPELWIASLVKQRIWLKQMKTELGSTRAAVG